MTTNTVQGIEVLEAANAEQWRAWLAANGTTERAVWLVIHNSRSATPNMQHKAVAEALCFGWIDSRTFKRDEYSRYQLFTPRNPRSSWSAVNRRLAAELIREGRMRPEGQARINVAQRTGRWDPHPDADNGIVPDDLHTALAGDAMAQENFAKFPPSSKRLILRWIAQAKRPETRRRRIHQTVDLAAQNIRANHPGVKRPTPA